MSDQKLLIDAVVASELRYGDGTIEGIWKAEAVVEGEDRRWSRTVMVVLENTEDGNWYAYEYEQGLTENQENEYPWEGDYHPTGQIELFRVYPKTKITTDYRRSV